MRRLLMMGLLAGTLMSAPANAAVQWTNWTSATTDPTAGSATGTAGTTGVTYSGELQQLLTGYPSWGPTATFNGAGSPPPSANGILRIIGGSSSLVNTITFNTAVVNPVIAIWSLGQGGIDASFNFDATPVLLSGGPSNEYAGTTLTIAGNTASGQEANGVVRFNGTFSSISWTNPVAENWYGFTVGVNAVPEPATWGMMILGFGAAGYSLRRRKAASTATATA